MLTHSLSNRFLNALERIQYGELCLHTPDGKTHHFKGDLPGACAEVNLYSWSVLGSTLRRGEIALAESYRDGLWDSKDLAAFLVFGLQNQESLFSYIKGNHIGRILARLSYFFKSNTLKGSKKNIHAHYDLGNDFYSLWLDETMTYSSALFHNPTEDLKTAQHNKYDRILDRIHDSGTVLEIGCGWGGFAERALSRGDYALKGLTISEEQHRFATQRLKGGATIAMEDYRIQDGRYDQIVSIEMFEAVGEQFWPIYFNKIKALLAMQGKAVIQTITIADEVFDDYRLGGDSIRSFIFPGGMLPSPQRFREEAIKAGLTVTDQFAFGADYARTLRCWLETFERKRDQVKALGFDEPFMRIWRYYLAFCIAAFEHGRTDVMQWELQHVA